MYYFEMFCLLIFAHMLADYPLQGDFLARAKNATNPIPGIPPRQALTAHAIIHGGFVGLITGSVWFALAEVVAHWVIDDAKCHDDFNFNTDQALHFLCKFLWVAIIFVMDFST